MRNDPLVVLLFEERIAEICSISYKGFVNNRITSFTDTFGKYMRALTAVSTHGLEDSITQGASLNICLFTQSIRTFRVLTPIVKSLQILNGSRMCVLSLRLPLCSSSFRSTKVRPDYLFKAHRRVHNLILCRPVNQMINIKCLTN